MNETRVANSLPVVVGVDGSVGSLTALAWAVSKQAILGPITPIAAFHVETFVEGIGMGRAYADLTDAVRSGAEERLATAVAGCPPDIAKRSRVLQGHAGPALVEIGRQGGMLVLGSRGRSALVETLFGSVGSYCVKHSEVPVAVIPDGVPVDFELETIVVGLDGSANSEAALAWARDHLSSSGTILAIGCWSANRGIEPVPVPGLMEDLRDETLAMLDRSVTSVFGESWQRSGREQQVRLIVEMGDPRAVLAEAAATADLLVIGSRGRRGIPHLLLGSVATSLLHHPTAPTVVVPG